MSARGGVVRCEGMRRINVVPPSQTSNNPMKIAIVVVLVLVVFLLFVASRPSSYRIERSAEIAAPVAAVFPHLNDLKLAAVWSPWLKIDPDVKVAYEGASSGVGAASTWAGNNRIGAGRQTIVESKADELVRIKLEFVKPMAGVAMTEFALKSDGGRTRVTWTMSGENGFVSKFFCLFMNQDKMIGGEFEKGLASLKTLVETGAK